MLRDLRFDTRMRTGEDVRYFAMVSSRMSSAIMVDRPLYFYRVRAGSLMTSRAPVTPASHTETPVPSEKTITPDNGQSTDLGLDTIRLFMNQAQNDSRLYWSIHGQLIDGLWKRLKNAYVANIPHEIDHCKKTASQGNASIPALECPPLPYALSACPGRFFHEKVLYRPQEITPLNIGVRKFVRAAQAVHPCSVMYMMFCRAAERDASAVFRMNGNTGTG